MGGRRGDREEPNTENRGQQPEVETQRRRTGGTGKVGTRGRNLKKEEASQYWLQMA